MLELRTGEGVVMAYCEMPDCYRKAVRNGLCETHRKRVQRGKAIGEPVRDPLTPYERALEAWTQHIDAEEEDDYHRTRVRALQASRSWACSDCGRCKPVPKR